MKFFLDTAKIEEITQAAAMGFLDGVTTNPSLVAQTGKSYLQVIQEICKVCKGPVSAEVLATDYAGMMEEARRWRKVAKNVVVKIPLTGDGLRAVKTCTEEGIPTNVTLCFNATQALLAAKAGATYISPFLGRLDDIGIEGMEVAQEIRSIYHNYEFSTQILAASLRHPLHVKQAALLGVDVITIPFKLLPALIHHPLTEKGLQIFLEDAKKIPV